MRGRVAGLVQASFAGAQIMGLPIGLFLANRWGWHAPFFMIVGVALLGGVAIVFVLQPITGHLAAAQGMGRKPVQHPLRTAPSAVTVGLMLHLLRLHHVRPGDQCVLSRGLVVTACSISMPSSRATSDASSDSTWRTSPCAGWGS